MEKNLEEYRRNIYSFIDYLHDNKDAFSSEISTINEINEIRKKQGLLNPDERYKDRIEFDRLQEEELKLLENLSSEAILLKAQELNLYSKGELTIEIRNRMNVSEHLASEIHPDEIDKIIDAKEKYIEFRRATDRNPLFCGFLLYDLDKALFPFFGAFTDVSDMDWMNKKDATADEAGQPINSDHYEKPVPRKKQYNVDTGLVKVIFDFCKKRNILRDEITEVDLVNRFAEADFSGEMYTARNKTKIQIIIHAVVYLEMMGAKTKDWYTDAVKSLGITKSECSRNHNLKFKDELDSAIKEYKKQR